MNSMNNEHFLNLAMKVIGRQATEAERAELDALLTHDPKLRAEFARLQEDARVAKNVLPLVDATQSETGDLPAYAQGRLQTKVGQTLGRPATEKEPRRSLALGWRWALRLAAVAAVIVVVLTVFHTPNETVIQVAMLDTTGGTRGTGPNEAALLQEMSKGNPVQNFSTASELEAWEKKWPNEGRGSAVKIIYDPAAAEVRVFGRSRGTTFQNTFLIEKDLASTLQRVNTFVREQTGK